MSKACSLVVPRLNSKYSRTFTESIFLSRLPTRNNVTHVAQKITWMPTKYLLDAETGLICSNLTFEKRLRISKNKVKSKFKISFDFSRFKRNRGFSSFLHPNFFSKFRHYLIKLWKNTYAIYSKLLLGSVGKVYRQLGDFSLGQGPVGGL